MIFPKPKRALIKSLTNIVVFSALLVTNLSAQIVTEPEVIVLSATQESEVRLTDRFVDHLVSTSQLRINKIVTDTLIPTHQHERFAQYHQGIKVHGAEVTRQTEAGVTVSIFGQFYPDIQIETAPSLPLDMIISTFDSGTQWSPSENILKELVILLSLIHI